MYSAEFDPSGDLLALPLLLEKDLLHFLFGYGRCRPLDLGAHIVINLGHTAPAELRGRRAPCLVLQRLVLISVL